ncbi:hypothetical protein DGWBC_0541 [Dehalogenimonas sp. WBC-2]|nr:hypothetical protein DGWBC_0541 [Dehalogenimonas sp. WBC-2]
MDIFNINDQLSMETKALSSKRINVTIFTIDAQFNGYIECQQQQRLLDVLNAITDRNNILGDDFLVINDVDVYYLQPKNSIIRHLSVGYIRRNNIVFVGENKCANDCKLEMPFGMREKKAISAEVEFPRMILRGYLYAETWQDLPGAINRKERFLPLTDVHLDSPLIDGVDKFEFVAVNRDRIICIGY